jgi:hypothetical protein
MSVDEFLNEKDTEYAHIEIGPGKYQRIGSLTGDDLIEFTEANDGPAKKTANARLILASMVDDAGNRTGDPKMIARLQGKSLKTINKLVDAIMKLNGMDKKADDAAKKD